MKSLSYVTVFYMMFHVLDANGTTCTEYSVIFQETKYGKFVFVEPVSPNNINWEEMVTVTNSSIRKKCTIELFCAHMYTKCPKPETRINHIGTHEDIGNTLKRTKEVDLGEYEDEFITNNIPSDSEKNPTTVLPTTTHRFKSKATDTIDGNYDPYSGSGGGPIGDHTEEPSKSKIFPTTIDETGEGSTIDDNDDSYSGSGEGSIGDHTEEPSTSTMFPKVNATNLNRNVTLNETEANNATAIGLVGKKWYETEAVIVTVAAAGTLGLLMFGFKTITTLMKSGTYVFPDP